MDLTTPTELANANVTVYTLMKLLDHESMVTSQRYVGEGVSQTMHEGAGGPLAV